MFCVIPILSDLWILKAYSALERKKKSLALLVSKVHSTGKKFLVVSISFMEQIKG